jgi:hypothetical protein
VTRTTATLANAAGIAGPVVLAVAVIACGAVVPGYDPVNQLISEIAARGGPGEHLAAIPIFITYVPALLLALFGVGLLGTRATRVIGVLVIVSSALRITTGIFPCDAGCDTSAPSAIARVHMLTAIANNLFILPAAAVTLALSLLRAGRSRRMAAYSLATAVLAVVFFMLVLAGSQNRRHIGVYQRASLGLSHAWLVTLAAWNWRRGRLDVVSATAHPATHPATD